GQLAIARIDLLRRGQVDGDARLVGAGAAEIGDAGVAADVVDLPERQGQAGAAEIGEAFGAMFRREAELVDIETYRPLEVRTENANVADCVALGKLHGRVRSVVAQFAEGSRRLGAA